MRKKMISKTGTPRSPHHFTSAESSAMQAMAATRSVMPRSGRWTGACGCGEDTGAV
ncbi:hypothetical protein LRS10_10755 [Phenylobacterium sp. J426]|uniref:hypothetical protein n=1 Tax=Phenylobacterium sp. J426 TaxID=2898439 RepID=UPI002150D942|nr:hypothetical protein [Phenylobacterium sp. J426]MCR5874603.1 hypothetical protein [Phenylobacterium sp. J426]